MNTHFFVHTNFLAFVCWLYVVYVLTAAAALGFFGFLNVCENLCMLCYADLLCMFCYADLLCMFCMFLRAVSALWNYSDFLRQIRCIP